MDDMRYSTLPWDFYESLLLAILLYPLRVFLDFLSHHFRFFHNAPYIANRTFCRGLFRDFTQTSHNLIFPSQIPRIFCPLLKRPGLPQGWRGGGWFEGAR